MPALLMPSPTIQGQIYQEEVKREPPQLPQRVGAAGEGGSARGEKGAEGKAGRHSSSLNTELTSPGITEQSSNNIRRNKSQEKEEDKDSSCASWGSAFRAAAASVAWTQR